MSNIRHSTDGRSNRKKSDPTSKANRNCDIRSDRMYTSNPDVRATSKSVRFLRNWNQPPISDCAISDFSLVFSEKSLTGFSVHMRILEFGDMEVIPGDMELEEVTKKIAVYY